MTSAHHATVVHAEPMWVVAADGHTSSHATQQLAIAAARSWLHQHGGGELIVRSESGHVQQRDVLVEEAPVVT